MGSKLMRGIGAFGLGLAAGGAAAYGDYRSRKKTQNSLLKAMGKADQVKEPTLKDFFKESTLGQAVTGTQAAAPVTDAKIRPVESAPEPATIDDPAGKTPDLATDVATAPKEYTKDEWDEIDRSDAGVY